MRFSRVVPVLICCAQVQPLLAQAAAAPLLPAAIPHSNVTSAGILANGVLTVALSAERVRWHPEADDGPAVTVDAFAVEGSPASVPGPLLRVRSGTRIESSIRNSLADTLLVFGLSGQSGDTIRIAPGATGRTRFTTGAPGTYAYGGATIVGDSVHLLGTGHQLLGALIVDGPEPVPDRIFVITLWTSDTAGFVMAINGRSWPHTDRLDVEVGEPVHWRVINGTRGRHPMHLHGFYFRVDSRGSWERDSILTGARPMVVTEAVPVHGTFTMTWTAERAGNWLFHCHDALHTSWRRRYNLMGMRPPQIPPVHDPAHHVEQDMSGLVLGIRARGGKPEAERSVATDGHAGASAATRRIRLVVNEKTGVYGRHPGLGYVTAEGADPARDSLTVPAQPLVLTRGEPAEITVVNRMTMATGVHWHGIELESFYDGVAGWSGADTTLAPMIEPADSFVVRMTPPRAGTFIFHAHVDDMRQIALGLYGALIVLPPGESWNAETDHVVVIGQVGLGPGRIVAINGTETPPPIVLSGGPKHRLRVINIAIQDDAELTLRRATADTSPVMWRAIAKDGADLEPERALDRPARLLIAPGETYDFELALPPGDYRLDMRSKKDVTMAVRVRADSGIKVDSAVTAFIDVNVVPMDAERVLRRQTVLVREGRITRIGRVSEVEVPADALRVEGQGRYLMPGLADMHIHLGPAQWPSHLTLLVANGVTTVRSTADASNGTRELREMVRSDSVLGPTIHTAGLHFDGDPPRHARSSIVVLTAEDARAAVRATDSAGYDFVKVYDGLSLVAYDATLDAARQAGVRVIGHVPVAVELEHALRSGQASIEHLHGYDLALQSDSSPFRSKEGIRPEIFNTGSGQRMRAWEHVDLSRLPALVALTKANGVWHCPTLGVFLTDALPDEVGQRHAAPEMRYVPSMLREAWVSQNWPEDVVRSARATQHARREIVRALHDAGVGILLGTDAANPYLLWGFSIHAELAELVKSGLTPFEAISAGTRNAAEFLEATSEFGTVETGKRADLILIDGNPLEDVGHIRKIAGVMLRGRWLPQRELQGALDGIAAEIERYEAYRKAQGS